MPSAAAHGSRRACRRSGPRPMIVFFPAVRFVVILGPAAIKLMAVRHWGRRKQAPVRQAPTTRATTTSSCERRADIEPQERQRSRIVILNNERNGSSNRQRGFSRYKLEQNADVQGENKEKDQLQSCAKSTLASGGPF